MRFFSCDDQGLGEYRRVHVRTSYIDDKQTSISRYGWKGPIRIGDMKYGSGKESIAHVTGDDEVQVWGQWHFGGPCVGLFQVESMPFFATKVARLSFISDKPGCLC